MESIFGPQLEIDQPTEAERDWIFNAMQAPRIHVPLSCPLPPTREKFDENLLTTHEDDGDAEFSVRWLIVRKRDTGAPAAFFIDFGWDGALDLIRDVDLAVPGKSGGISLYLEANLLVAIYLFRHKLAKRLRWRVRAEGSSHVRWWGKVGVRQVTVLEEAHPITGEAANKVVYELTPVEYAKILARGAVDLLQEEREYRLPLRKIVRLARDD